MTLPEKIDIQQVTQLGLEALGVPESEDGLSSDAAIASALRRAASFGSPIARPRLVRSVVAVVAGHDADREDLKAWVNELLDRLLDHGDLLEISKSELGPRRHIVLRPPAFVIHEDTCFLLGVRPDGAPLLADEKLDSEVVHAGAIRTIRPCQDGVRQALIDAGLQEVSIEQWISAPREISASDLIEIYRARLAESPDVGEVEGVEILDPKSDRSFYRGRFRCPTNSEAGFFVTRRPQQFGPSRWCFAEFEHGQTQKVIDFPVVERFGMPTDEVWRLQAAIDWTEGHPQFARVTDRAKGEALLSFFAPLPSWARKRLDLVGGAVHGARSALFSYRLDDGALAAESEFLSSHLWLQVEEVN